MSTLEDTEKYHRVGLLAGLWGKMGDGNAGGRAQKGPRIFPPKAPEWINPALVMSANKMVKAKTTAHFTKSKSGDRLSRTIKILANKQTNRAGLKLTLVSHTFSHSDNNNL